MKSLFTTLQVVGTVALAAAVEQFAAKDYWVAISATLVGILAYVVYELIPPKSEQ
jgi:hypothetical protein